MFEHFLERIKKHPFKSFILIAFIIGIVGKYFDKETAVASSHLVPVEQAQLQEQPKNLSPEIQAELQQKIADWEKIANAMIEKKKAFIDTSGVATPSPCLDFIIMKKAYWNKLTKEQKISLCLYVRNTVNEAKKFPHRFTRVPRTAPAYQPVIQKISKMDAESWMISNNDGGTPFVMGDMAWERYQAKDEDISFATFSGGRYYPQLGMR